MSKNKLLSIATAVLMAFSAVSCSSEKNVKPEPDIPEVNKTAEKVSENSFKKITRFYEQIDISDTDMSYSIPVAADQDKYYYFQGGRDFAYEMPENYEVYCADINSGSVEYSEFADVPAEADIMLRNEENILYILSEETEQRAYGYNIKSGKTTELKEICSDRALVRTDRNGNIYIYSDYKVHVYDISFNKTKEINVEKSMKEELDENGIYLYGMCVSGDGQVYFTVAAKYQWAKVLKAEADGSLTDLTGEMTDYCDNYIVREMYTDEEGNIVVCAGYGDVRSDVISPENGDLIKRYEIYGEEDLIGPGAGYDMIYKKPGGIYGYSYMEDSSTALVTSEDITEMDDSYSRAFYAGDKLYIVLGVKFPSKIIVLDREGKRKEYESDDLSYADTDSEGNLVYISSRHYLDSDEDYGTFEAVDSKVFRLDNQGNNIFLFSFPLYHGEVYPLDIKICSNGNIACVYPASEEDNLYSSFSILIFDESGNVVKTIGKPTEDYFYPSLVKNEKSELFVMNRSDGTKVYRLNEETGELTETAFDKEAEKIFDGNGGYDFYYMDNSGLHGYKAEENISEEILYYSECDEDIANRPLIIISPSEFIGCEGKKYVEMSDEKLEKFNSRKIITVAAVNSGDIQPYINRYNKTSEDCRIFLKEYETDTEKSHAWNDISSKLNQDISAGDIPDIIITDNMDVSSYVKSGLFTDHRKLVENDPEISNDVLNQPVCEAFTYKDSLYCIPVLYSSQILYSSENTENWDFKKMAEMIQNNEKFLTPYSAPDFFTAAYISDKVDTEAGKCDFETEEFCAILELIKRYSENLADDFDYSETEEYMMEIVGINNIGEYHNPYTDRPYICGFPSESGNGKRFIYPLLTFAVTEASENKAEAWDFIRTVISEGGGDRGYVAYGFIENNDETENYPEETVKGYREYLDMPAFTDVMYSRIYRIISEETEAFTAGQKTAEETAKTIQNKVSLMLSETE